MPHKDLIITSSPSWPPPQSLQWPPYFPQQRPSNLMAAFVLEGRCGNVIKVGSISLLFISKGLQEEASTRMVASAATDPPPPGC